MAKGSILAGATSQSVNIFIQDSSSTVGAGLSGLVYNTAGLAAYYTFTGANATATSIALATLAAVNSAYSSGGFKELDSTHMKGLYRLDIPNAALVTSSGQFVTIYLYGATNMAPCVFEIELTGWNNQDGVHGGMTALPNTAVTTNGSLITSGTGTDQLSVTSGRIDIGKSLGTAVTLDANNVLNVSAKYWAGGLIPAPNVTGVPFVDLKYTLGTLSPAAAGYVAIDWGQVANKTTTNALTGTTIATSQTIATVTNQLTAAQIATGVWQDVTTGDFTVASSIGNSLYTGNHAPGAASGLALVGSNMGTITGALTAAQIATGVWQDATAGDFTASASIGKSVMNGVALGTGLTINAYTGNTVQTGDAYARLGAPAGASTAADIAAVKAVLPTALTGGGNIKADALAIAGSTTAATALNNSTNSICWGTCSGGTTTTAVVGTLNNPSSLTDANQLQGRTIIFLGATGTADVQSQASNITASTTGSTPTITFTAMTHAPANGDTFVVL